MLPTISERLREAKLYWLEALRNDVEALRISGQVSLPRFSGSRLCVASDYSGDPAPDGYQTLAMLFCDLHRCRPWLNQRAVVRRKFLSDGRRISFKDMKDAKCRAALLPFLDAADLMPGVCVIVGIQDRVRNLTPIDVVTALGALLAPWKPKVREKLIRIAGIMGLFLGMVSRPDQDVIWISDEDEIIQSRNQRSAFNGIVRKLTALCLPHPLGQLKVLTTAHDDGSRELEDLTAIPDLCAGAVAEALTALQSDGRAGSRIIAPIPSSLSPKSQYICQWLARRHCALERLVLTVRAGKPGRVHVGHIEMDAAISPDLVAPRRFHIDRLRGKKRLA